MKYGIALKSNDSSIEFSDNSQLKSLLHRIASEKKREREDKKRIISNWCSRLSISKREKKRNMTFTCMSVRDLLNTGNFK